MTPDQLADVLRRCDAGEYAGPIATSTGLPAGEVYAALREHRPDRGRKPRAHTSQLRPTILKLREIGCDSSRIVFLMKGKCARAYIYKILGEARRVSEQR